MSERNDRISNLIFRLDLDPDETMSLYVMQNFEICYRKKLRLIFDVLFRCWVTISQMFFIVKISINAAPSITFKSSFKL